MCFPDVGGRYSIPDIWLVEAQALQIDDAEIVPLVASDSIRNVIGAQRSKYGLFKNILQNFLEVDAALKQPLRCYSWQD